MGAPGSRGPPGPQGPKATHSVYFAAYKHSDSNPEKGETITYDKVISNKGNGLNPGSGIFKAPVPGFYFFTFFGETLRTEKTVTSIYIHHNSPKFSFGERNGDENSFGTVSGSWQFKLEKYDTVKITVK